MARRTPEKTTMPRMGAFNLNSAPGFAPQPGTHHSVGRGPAIQSLPMASSGTMGCIGSGDRP